MASRGRPASMAELLLPLRAVPDHSDPLLPEIGDGHRFFVSDHSQTWKEPYQFARVEHDTATDRSSFGGIAVKSLDDHQTMGLECQDKVPAVLAEVESLPGRDLRIQVEPKA